MEGQNSVVTFRPEFHGLQLARFRGVGPDAVYFLPSFYFRVRRKRRLGRGFREKAVCVPDRQTSNNSISSRHSCFHTARLSFCMFGEGLSGPGARGVGIYELKGVLDTPKISFIMCSLLSEEVGGHSFIYTSSTTFFSSFIFWPSIVCRSISLTSFLHSSSGPQNLLLKFSYSLRLQIRSTPDDSNDASVATNSGRLFLRHFDFALVHCPN